jgi:hypothetical protein
LLSFLHMKNAGIEMMIGDTLSARGGLLLWTLVNKLSCALCNSQKSLSRFINLSDNIFLMSGTDASVSKKITQCFSWANWHYLQHSFVTLNNFNPLGMWTEDLLFLRRVHCLCALPRHWGTTDIAKCVNCPGDVA